MSKLIKHPIFILSLFVFLTASIILFYDPTGHLKAGELKAVNQFIKKRAETHILKSIEKDIKIPNFGDGQKWLNTEKELSWEKDIKGNVLLIDFWTYCCINCLHVLPDLAYLEKKYKDRNFVVVGNHSAKFENEKLEKNIRKAILRYDIEHPVVIDNDFLTWRLFGVRSWPTFALVAPDGTFLASLSGEGNREILDALIEVTFEIYEKKNFKFKKENKPKIKLEKDDSGLLSFPSKMKYSETRKELFIVDSNHDRILVLSKSGKFKYQIGSGKNGYKDGNSNEAMLSRPQGIAFYKDELIIADTKNHSIRAYNFKSQKIRTLAGDGLQGYERQGKFKADKVSLNSPWDLLILGDTMYIAMAGPHQIWSMNLKTNEIGVFSGDGSEQNLNGKLLESAFAQPSGFAYHKDKIYIADSESSSVRVIDLKKNLVSTLAGGNLNPRDLFHFGDEDGKGPGRRFQHLLDLTVIDGVLYVADTYNHKIKTVNLKNGEVKNFAGSGKIGSKNSNLKESSFHEPSGLLKLGNQLLVADTNNHKIRVIDLKKKLISDFKISGIKK